MKHAVTNYRSNMDAANVEAELRIRTAYDVLHEAQQHGIRATMGTMLLTPEAKRTRSEGADELVDVDAPREDSVKAVFEMILDIYTSKVTQQRRTMGEYQQTDRRVTRAQHAICAICQKPTRNHVPPCYVECAECGVRGGLGAVGSTNVCVNVPSFMRVQEEVKVELRWKCPQHSQ
jgi:hypothetical protein